VDPGVLPELDEVRPFDRAQLVRALFRRRNDRAERMIDPIFDGFESVVAEAAIDGMATWGDPQWLRDVIARPPMTGPASLPRELRPVDVRPHAAYYLARAGDPDGLAVLIAWANENSRARAEAVRRLAWLGHPAGIAPTAKLLRSRGGEPLELALDAAENYRSPLLSEALEALATRRGEIAREAVEALSWIAAPNTDTDEPELERVREQLSALDPSRRYACGEPLTLAILVDELAERDEAPRTGAAHNLVAITGEDHGFDLDDDLAGNLAAIDAWRERARDPAPMGEGGWAFRGEPLAPPTRP
jgi:HEAT repeat protein